MLTYCSCGCAWNPDWYTDCPKCDPIGIAQQEDQWEATMFGYGEILNPHYERDVPDPCPNCGGSKAVRNPTGSCDHLYWPDNLTPEAKRKVEQADALLRAIHASNS